MDVITVIDVDSLVWFGLWGLTHFQQYFSYIVAVSFIYGVNRRKLPTFFQSH